MTIVQNPVLHDAFSQGGLPESNHVSITPKRKPTLKYFIKSISWDCVNQTISLEIAETASFSAFEWLCNINVVRAALLKSPFCDLEQDFLLLEFNDDKDNPIATVKLKGLELVHHNCAAGRELHKPLSHCAVIKYDKLEVKHVEQRSNTDDEWTKDVSEMISINDDIS